ncbi:MAG: DUF192 domain-containing protein [Alphaproteobacteria bacterium]|nr:MAG: DUF192 domain-containing protein [Alphaproteobacteria bacterium]
MRLIIATLLLLGFMNCAIAQDGAKTNMPYPPEEKSETTEMVILGTNGKQHRFTIEIARTEAQKAKGLMNRTELGADQGMIFLFDPPVEVGMWMKNTLIPLDMVFVNDKNRIFRLREGKPMDLTILRSMGKTTAVIELPGGTVKKQNIRLGDRILTPVLKNQPSAGGSGGQGGGMSPSHN